MSTATLRVARRFLALGGKLMIDPQGKTTFGLDAEKLFSLALTSRQRVRGLRVARAARTLCWRNPGDLAGLINEHGKPFGGWVVWEGR